MLLNKFMFLLIPVEFTWIWILITHVGGRLTSQGADDPQSLYGASGEKATAVTKQEEQTSPLGALAAGPGWAFDPTGLCTPPF